MSITSQIKETSKVSRELTITVPAEFIQNQYQRQINQVQKSVDLKGFRKGMVPIAVVEQRYGKEIQHELYHQVVEEGYRMAIVEHKLRPVSQPQIDTGHDANDHSSHHLPMNKAFVFKATVEVMPEIEVKNYKGLSLTRTAVEVKDKDVDEVVEQLRGHHAQLLPVLEDRAVKKGDHIDFEFDGGKVTDAGVEKLEGMKGKRILEVGAGELIPGFEDHLIGMKAGESKTFRIDFPKDYMEANLKGAEAEFEVRVHELKKKKLPEVTEEFAKEAGYESLSDMREKLKKGLTMSREDESKRQLKSDLLEALIKKNPFDVPGSLVDAQAQNNAQHFIQNLQRQGFDQSMIAEALTKEQKTIKDKAEQQVRAGLLLDQIGELEKVEVTEKDLANEYQRISAEVGMSEAEVKKYYSENPQQRENFEFQVRENLVVEKILSESKIKEK